MLKWNSNIVREVAIDNKAVKASIKFTRLRSCLYIHLFQSHFFSHFFPTHICICPHRRRSDWAPTMKARIISTGITAAVLAALLLALLALLAALLLARSDWAPTMTARIISTGSRDWAFFILPLSHDSLSLSASYYLNTSYYLKASDWPPQLNAKAWILTFFFFFSLLLFQCPAQNQKHETWSELVDWGSIISYWFWERYLKHL